MYFLALLACDSSAITITVVVPSFFGHVICVIWRDLLVILITTISNLARPEFPTRVFTQFLPEFLENLNFLSRSP